MDKIKIGASAETAAIRILREHDYEIVERNWRCPNVGELDIVARGPDREMLVFVEVRSRADAEHGFADEMVDRHKQRQVVRVAGHYLMARDPHYEDIRFDVVAITGDEIDLIVDAFRA